MTAKQMEELFRQKTTRVKSIAFHPTLPVLVTGNHCGTVAIWDYQYGQNVKNISEHVGSVRVVRFHPSGELFATGGDDKIVRVWSYKSRQPVHRLKGHADYVRCLDFHPTSPWLISCSDDCTVRIWNYYTGEQLCSSSGHSHYVMAVCFLDSSHFLTGSLDHTLGLWNCGNLLEKKKSFIVPGAILVQSIEGHDRGINTLSFKDNQVLSGSDDKEIRCWNYEGDVLLAGKVLTQQNGGLTSLAQQDGRSIGVTEDGELVVYMKDGHLKEKMELGTRCWAVATKEEYIAVGTDDGLVLFRYGGSQAVGVDDNKAYYVRENALMEEFMHDEQRKEEEVGEVDKWKRITSIKAHSGNVVVQYADCYDLFRDKSTGIRRSGVAAYHSNALFTISDGMLYKDGKPLADGVAGYLFSTAQGLVVVDGPVFRMFDATEDAFVGGPYTAAFPILDVISSSTRLALIGRDKIALFNSKMHLLQQIDEKVRILGAILSTDILIYATVRQIKYFFGGVGVLLSLSVPVVPVALIEAKDGSMSTLAVLDKACLKYIGLNMAEIEFRRAVANGADILSVIETSHLPGLSPLAYLVENGRGSVALPYIKDPAVRFSLLLSDGRFKEAMEICHTEKMWREVAEKAMTSESYGIAEECYKKVDDEISLFFLYVATGQPGKLGELRGGRVGQMAGIVLEDRSMLGSLVDPGVMGTAQRVSQIGIISRSEEDKLEAEENKLEAEENKLEAEDIQSESEEILLETKLEIPSESEDNISEGGEISSEGGETNRIDSTADSNMTSMLTVDGSEPRLGLFDQSLVLPGAVKDTDSGMRRALDLTTEGKFSEAVDEFRAIISGLALELKGADARAELRRKIGVYLWGLGLEMKRRELDDPAKALEVVLFFASLPMEPNHAMMAKALAMGFAYKNKNYDTAKKIAAELQKGKLALKVLNSPNSGDKYSVAVRELCYDTLEYEEASRCCRMCYVKSKEGEICGACGIGLID